MTVVDNPAAAADARTPVVKLGNRSTKPSSTKATPPDVQPPPRGTVLDVYDILRVARMNVLYYGDRLWWVQAQSVAADVLTALVASSGLIAAWRAAGFTTVPIAMGIVTAALTVLRPILNFQARIKRLAGLWSGYLGTFQTADQIARAVRADRTVTAKQRALLANVHDRFDALERNDDPVPSTKTLNVYRARVISEIPVDDWWVPEEGTATSVSASAAAGTASAA